jgi:hypothetical protein
VSDYTTFADSRANGGRGRGRGRIPRISAPPRPLPDRIMSLRATHSHSTRDVPETFPPPSATDNYTSTDSTPPFIGTKSPFASAPSHIFDQICASPPIIIVNGNSRRLISSSFRPCSVRFGVGGVGRRASP